MLYLLAPHKRLTPNGTNNDGTTMRNPTFAKLTFGIVEFFSSHSFVHFGFTSILLHVRIIPTCIILSCLPYFCIARLQMELSAQDVRRHCGELHSET